MSHQGDPREHELFLAVQAGVPMKFNEQDFLTPPRGVLSLHTLVKFYYRNPGFAGFLWTGCTDVETQANARVLGL